MTLYFTVLGPIGATADGVPVQVDRPRRRGFLAYLLLNAGRAVTLDKFTTAIWGGTPPSTAKAQIQSEIWALRQIFKSAAGAETIATRPGGYLLELPAGQFDLGVYTEQTSLARAEADRGDGKTAAKLMREALALWKGPALSGASADFVEPTRIHLEEKRLADVEWLAELELGLGGHHELIPDLTRYVAEHPLRERLRAQLMIALYRSGRRPEAPAVAHEARKVLDEGYGLDLSPRLRDLVQADLCQDARLDVARHADRPS
jgi:DNA-binding SARP family transcriptional activator